MGVPVLVSSTDSGAPVLDEANNNRFVELMRFAFPLLGWTEEFFDSGTNKVVFRNDPINGSGGYIQLTPNASNNTRANTYTAMTAIDTGSNASDDAFVFHNFPRSNPEWWVLGDEKTAWVFIRNSNAQEAVALYFGDYDALHTTDTYPFVVFGRTTASLGSFDGYGVFQHSTSNTLRKSLEISGLSGPDSLEPSQGGNLFRRDDEYGFADAGDLNGETFLSRFFIGKEYQICGSLRGGFVPSSKLYENENLMTEHSLLGPNGLESFRYVQFSGAPEYGPTESYRPGPGVFLPMSDWG